MDRRFKSLDALRQVYQSECGPAAQRALRAEAGDRLMARIYTLIEQMDDSKASLLKERLERA
ncbi:hypothetical protein [Variovorax sp. HJSM1_2]|uniref:hypothetical protein n=1 Tax=Variovorax sp. HJSM1_2 TaxID=3366263 RepID=UPI003BD9573A